MMKYIKQSMALILLAGCAMRAMDDGTQWKATFKTKLQAAGDDHDKIAEILCNQAIALDAVQAEKHQDKASNFSAKCCFAKTVMPVARQVLQDQALKAIQKLVAKRIDEALPESPVQPDEEATEESSSESLVSIDPMDDAQWKVAFRTNLKEAFEQQDDAAVKHVWDLYSYGQKTVAF